MEVQRHLTDTQFAGVRERERKREKERERERERDPCNDPTEERKSSVLWQELKRG